MTGIGGGRLVDTGGERPLGDERTPSGKSSGDDLPLDTRYKK